MPYVGVSGTEENGKKEKWQWGRRSIHKLHTHVAINQCVEVHGALPVTKGINFKSGKLNEQPIRKSVC
jgi:hypothetical protein